MLLVTNPKLYSQNGLASCFIFQEPINLGDCSVEGTDSEFMIRDVHDQVLAHNGQTDKAEVSTEDEARLSAGNDASMTSATVSKKAVKAD